MAMPSEKLAQSLKILRSLQTAAGRGPSGRGWRNVQHNAAPLHYVGTGYKNGYIK